MESLAIAGFGFIAALLATVFIVAVATHSISAGAHGACSAASAYRCSDSSLAKLCADHPASDSVKLVGYCERYGKGQ